MALSQQPSRDEIIAGIQAIPGVEEFEWNKGFKCITVTEGTDYNDLITQMSATGLDCSEIFIHDPKRHDGQWSQFHCTNLSEWHHMPVPQKGTFEAIHESVLNEYRFSGDLRMALNLKKILAKDKVRTVLDMTEQEGMFRDMLLTDPYEKIRFLERWDETSRAKWFKRNPEDKEVWNKKHLI